MILGGLFGVGAAHIIGLSIYGFYLPASLRVGLSGPQAVTLKAVAGRIGRTHANLLHHFGSAAELQAALAGMISDRVTGSIAEAVERARQGTGDAREFIDMTFDAFDREGAGQLAAWMILSGNEDALDPIIEAIHDLVDELHDFGSDNMRQITLTLCLMALGDAQLGGPLSQALGLPRTSARDTAEAMLTEAAVRAGLREPPQAG